ncbi:MAG: hypothetical protein ONB24_11690 [candidate division KSB1 bacterium]|nr:hypothetical protein [candidate division KSB1 bacterium]
MKKENANTAAGITTPSQGLPIRFAACNIIDAISTLLVRIFAIFSDNLVLQLYVRKETLSKRLKAYTRSDATTVIAV